MDRVIPYNLKRKVFVYLDDLIRKVGLTINVAKSKLCMTEARYLGYIVGAGMLKSDPEKV